MVHYNDLIGKSHEEIDRELTYSHKVLLKVLAVVKTQMDINPMNITNYYPEKLQTSLIYSTGYMSKHVDYNSKEVTVTFSKTITPANELMGKGKNELEAICNACDNLINNPSDYNTHSKKYFDKLNK